MAEGGVKEDIKTFSHKLVCQLCEKIFEEDIPIACVHLTFCRSCLEQNGLPDYLEHGMVCTQCSKISVSRLQEALHISGSTSSSTPSPSGSSQPTNVGGTKPCNEPGCETCNRIKDLSTMTFRNGKTMDVIGNFNCNSKFVNYCIRCERCAEEWVGKTSQKLKTVMSDLYRDIKNESCNRPLSADAHFKLSDHTIDDLRVSVTRSQYNGKREENDD